MRIQWEYRFIEVYIARGDGEDVSGRRVRDMGVEGWELVCATPASHDSPNVRLYFKRPL